MANIIFLTFFLPVLLLSAGRCDVKFTFENLCPFSVWRASKPSIGDLLPEIPPDIYEIFNMDDIYSGVIWVRTGCKTNASNYFSCDTGDCRNGVKECADLAPQYPVTLLKFYVHKPVVSYQVSLVHGQNMLVRIKPNGGTLVDGSGPCPMVECNKNLESVCPPYLKAFRNGRYVGCNSACDALREPKYCCNGVGCKPDEISLKFKGLCPLAHTYPGDFKPPIYRCRGAESIGITFCPPP